MNSAGALQFLRPYAIQRLRSSNQAYLRLYDGVRRRGITSRSGRRCLATTSNADDAKPVLSDWEKDAAESRSHAVEARIQELSRVNSLAYPRVRKSSTALPMRIPTFREKYRDVSRENPGEEEVVLHGRLQSVRRAGSKLVFLDVTGEFERVQAMCNFRNLEPAGVELTAFKNLAKLLQRGDLISIRGKAVRTQTGELSLTVTQLPQLLAPSLVPLPFKLEEDNARVQNRHIDLLVNRETVDVLRLRSYIMKYMRDFFHDRGFLEFQTPILAENAGGAIARPFTTSSPYLHSEELALRIAPELWLKRLVVGGVEKVFEMGPAFRNEGIDLSHNPEFTMCEFYNAYASLDDLISQTEELISGLAAHCHELISTKLTSLPPIDLAKYRTPFKQLEFIPSVESALGFTLPDLDTPTAQSDLLSLLQSHNHPLATDPSVSSAPLPKLLDKLAATYLEPSSLAAPLYITHHPACMSPLSKSFLCPKTKQLVSARTELFVDGRELANMYEEENDPFAQRRKFAEQSARHSDAAATGEEVVADESYVRALESGLPPTGGWGCGIERLVMAFSGARRISDTLSFGNLRNVVGLSAGRKKE